jgi:hypothetical protein
MQGSTKLMQTVISYFDQTKVRDRNREGGKQVMKVYKRLYTEFLMNYFHY